MADALAAWLSTTIGQYAAAYAKTSYVLPLHGITADLKCTCGASDCKSAGKHPFTKHGLKDASNNIEQIAALFNYREDLNIGLLTGEKSGFFVVDVDGNKGGFESLENLFQAYGEFDPTVIIKTGNGVHIWFAYPQGIHIGNRTNLLPGIDVRGEGGYVVAAPSRHASGVYYEPTETSARNTIVAPAWLTAMVQTKKEKIEPVDRNSTSGAKSEWSAEEIQGMLDCINPSLGYSDWIAVGMGIHSGGYPYKLWDDWSSRGSNYERNCCAPHWRSFKTDGGISLGTLVQMAQLAGWKPTPKEREIVDTSNVQLLIKKAEKALKPAAVKKPQPMVLGFNALELPGLIGDTVRWITKHAIFKQPELALINTLAFAGSVFGRRYSSPLNTRTNLYMVGIAGTGDGKDHSRKAIKELAHASGLDDRIGADAIRSDSGMLRGLMNNCSQLMMIDEFGHFLQAIGDDKSPHYIRSQIGILLKLYSTSNSIYNHGEYADSKTKSIIIQYPNLCIYGTSTEEKYAKSLKKSAIDSGELNRFITIKSRQGKQYPDKIMPAYEIEQSLINRWSEFSPKIGSSLGDIVNSSDMAPDPITIPWGDCDEIQYAIQCKQVDKTNTDSPIRSLWGRMFENTVKIAMILAIARDKNKPQFKPEDFDTAQMIVESSIEYLSYLAGTRMSETPQEDSNNEIVNAIIEAGGEMGRRDIMRKFRKLKKRDLDEVLGSLIEQEIIEADKAADEGKGRPKTVYKIVKDNNISAVA